MAAKWARAAAAVSMLCALPLVVAYQPRLTGLPALRTPVVASPAHCYAPATEAGRRALGLRESSPRMKEEEPTSEDAPLLLSAAIVGGLIGLQLTGACKLSRHRSLKPDPNPNPCREVAPPGRPNSPNPSPEPTRTLSLPHTFRSVQVISCHRSSSPLSSCSVPLEPSQKTATAPGARYRRRA